MKKVTITGTKGKTTVSSLLALILQQVEDKILNVDTSGAYINGDIIINKSQSQLIWDVVPTIAPGRFLYLLHNQDVQTVKEGEDHSNTNGVAILEASLGCGTESGLGYYGHDVGVFTNVFEDHLGSRADLVCREDIGKSKSFVFSRINRDGYAVFNADDDVVCANLFHCKEGVKLIPFGLNFDNFNIDEHLKNGGMALTIDDKNVVLMTGLTKQNLFNFSNIPWMFDGMFLPSLYNLLAITGALIGYSNGDMLSSELIEAICNSKLDADGGRLTLLRNSENVTILADYAHEKQSLKSVADLARKLKSKKDNSVIGVVRLAWDRTDELIKDTADYIAESYDSFIVYDKIDGYWRNPSSRFRPNQRQFAQEVGKISNLFTESLIEHCGSGNVVRIIREDEAIIEASKQAKPGDVVIVIVNDNIERSIGFIKDAFGAELI